MTEMPLYAAVCVHMCVHVCVVWGKRQRSKTSDLEFESGRLSKYKPAIHYYKRDLIY